MAEANLKKVVQQSRGGHSIKGVVSINKSLEIMLEQSKVERYIQEHYIKLQPGLQCTPVGS